LGPVRMKVRHRAGAVQSAFGGISNHVLALLRIRSPVADRVGVKPALAHPPAAAIPGSGLARNATVGHTGSCMHRVRIATLTAGW